MNFQNLYSSRTASMRSSLIRELVASTKNIPDLISFAGGFPAPATFPRQMLAGIFYDVVQNEGYDVLQYGSSEGDDILKAELRQWDGYPDLDPNRMLIAVGATNAIYYYARTLLNEGDVVLCEAPSFLGSIVAYDALGAEVRGIPMDDEGIDLNILQTKLLKLRQSGRMVKFLYSIPDFQNPSGVSMSLPRRQDLIRFCIDHDLPILEDNPYSRLRYQGKALPTLFRLAQEMHPATEIVTEVVSFSKILGPGARFAYVKGDKDLINRMCAWQQKVNISPDCVTQRVVARFLEKGFMDPHINAICDYYQPFLHTMLGSLAQFMPEGIQWTKPDGGIFLWLRLPARINADELFVQAREHKVSFIPGSKFYPFGEERYNCLRLNFSYPTTDQIREGVKRLADLLKQLIT